MLGIGFFFALLSSSSLGLTVVAIRRGVLKGSPAVATLITVLTGVPLFVLAAVVTGQLFRASAIEAGGYVALAITGVLQMVIGRYSFYRSIQAIGGNQAELFQALQVPLSIAIALVFLDETLGLQIAIGVGLVMAGPMLVVLAKSTPKASVAPESNDKGNVSVPQVRMREGLLFGLIAIISFSAGDVLARGVLADSGLGLLGGLVIYLTAAVVLVGWVVASGRFSQISETSASAANRWFLLAALIGFLAQMSRYVALAFAPVYLVVPLMRTVPLFVLIFSFLLNRRLEVFSPKLVAGVLAAVLGLIILAF
jgi:drug/metabolite transporter (DMT)-like permease